MRSESPTRPVGRLALALAFLPLLLLAWRPGPAAPRVPALGPAPTSQDEPFAAARAALAAGDLEKAEETARLELASRPYDRDGYELLLTIAERAEDEAAILHWGTWLYWSLRYGGDPKGAAEVAERLDAVWEGWRNDEPILDEWRKAMLKGVKGASSKKQYRLAGHLLNKLLEFDPSDKKLQKEWDKLVDKAGQEVSGGAFVADEVRRHSAEWIARQNARHESWENRWRDRTRYYEIETNLDYEFFETLKAAMDQIHEFYRDTFDYKKKAPRARIAVHRKRSDFDRFSLEILGRAIQSESVGGYWVAAQNTVAAYDRSYGNPNMTREDLWHTLFHEASHQFTTLLMGKNAKRGLITPAWLNEGTATYFEGCVIKADGTILKNDVAKHRLRSWWWIEHSASQKSLEDLVAHVRNTGADSTGTLSYEGVFYPYGWALVYFLLNYEENDRRVYGPPITGEGGIPEELKTVRKAGRLVYREPYLKYLEFYAKEGNKENDQYQPLEKAKEIFVEEVGDPDVPNWEAFENRWRRFTTSLYGEMQAGWEFADVLLARSRGYVLAGDWERARITAEQADAKRPNDPDTYALLAEANWGEGRKGEAPYWMFRNWELMWAAGDEEGMDRAEEWLQQHGAGVVVKEVCQASRTARAAIEEKMEEALAEGHPVLAALHASHLQQALGLTFPDLAAEAAEMADLAGEDLRMWQAAFDKGEAGNRKLQLSTGDRSLVQVVGYRPDGVLIYNPKGRDTPGYERCEEGSLAWLKPPYAIRGKVQVDGKAAQILLGLDRNGRPRVELEFSQHGDESQLILSKLIARVDALAGVSSLEQRPVIGGGLPDKVDVFDFEFVVEEDGKARLTVGELELEVRADEIGPRLLEGGFALSVSDDTAALFQDVEVRPNRPFWPVAPPDPDE